MKNKKGQIGVYIKWAIFIILLACLFFSSKMVDKIGFFLFAWMLPSLVLSYFIGLVIEAFGGDILNDWYLTFEYGWFKFSITLFAIAVVVIKFLILRS